MSARVYPIFVSALGVAGLSSALAYLGGALLAFTPGWEAWAEFFVPRALPFLVAPYVLLLTHLYLRTHLGGWYLKRGLAERAVAYCERRLGHNLLRSHSEALAHRIYLARAHIFLGAYETARELLDEGYKLPKRGKSREEVARWKMEIALRQENLLYGHRAWETVARAGRPTPKSSELHACRAELAARENARDDYFGAMERALWKGSGSSRVLLARVLGELKFSLRDSNDLLEHDEHGAGLEQSVEELKDGLKLKDGSAKSLGAAGCLEALERIAPKIMAEIPAREAELMAIRAQLFYKNRQNDQARKYLLRAEAAQDDSDSRARFVVEQTRKRLDEVLKS